MELIETTLLMKCKLRNEIIIRPRNKIGPKPILNNAIAVTDEMKGTLFCVSEPKTAILGGPDIHLKEGSTMNLTCRITDSPEPPSYIFWRHDDSVRHAIRTHTL